MAGEGRWTSFSQSSEIAENIGLERLAPTPPTLPPVHELGQTPQSATRRSSSVSYQSLFAVEDPSTSSDTGSHSSNPSANTSSTEQRKGKVPRLNRQVSENIPPSSTKRRQSLDLGSRVPSVPELKRSGSLWAHPQPQRMLDDAAGEFQDRYLRNFGTGTMSERRRTLNVKRARKMAQVFGQEPPSELIQIQDEREKHDHFRDSTATLSTFLTVAPLRDRANSNSSTATVANENVNEDGNGAEGIPATPPPFSTSHVVDDPESSTHTTSFQERRRRAAKLSRFFGVGFQDIDISLSPETAPAPAPAPTPPFSDSRAEVDVKVSGRRFWGFNDRSKDGDMQEAIQKLRGLRAG
ncbi:hypothetical protein C8R43DRAFT_896262 [Mycena crocata]|nr:hypothetical protein C8R43DRAFT_896262 [Mycena crocata]